MAAISSKHTSVSCQSRNAEPPFLTQEVEAKFNRAGISTEQFFTLPTKDETYPAIELLKMSNAVYLEDIRTIEYAAQFIKIDKIVIAFHPSTGALKIFQLNPDPMDECKLILTNISHYTNERKFAYREIIATMVKNLAFDAPRHEISSDKASHEIIKTAEQINTLLLRIAKGQCDLW